MAQETVGEVTIIDSVHVSPEHFELIREKIAETSPDIVAVELCGPRFQAMLSDESPSIRDVIREQPLWKTTVHTIMKFVQSRMRRKAGVHPEMSDLRTAVEAAAHHEVDVALIDRPMDETLQSLSDNVRDPVQLATMIGKAVAKDEEDVPEELRDVDLDLDNMGSFTDPEFIEAFTEFSKENYPPIWHAFIDERDEIMAKNLHALAQDGQDVTAIVGAAHGPGIRRYLSMLEGTDGGETPPIRTVRLN